MPPPGRKPIGTSPSSPFSASLKPPSPEKTITHVAAGAAGVGHELGRVPRVLRLHDRELDDARELALDRGEPRVGDAGREGVDDEDGLH